MRRVCAQILPQYSSPQALRNNKGANPSEYPAKPTIETEEKAKRAACGNNREVAQSGILQVYMPSKRPAICTLSSRSCTSFAGDRYRIVVSRDLWPIQCCTVRTSKPARSIRVA